MTRPVLSRDLLPSIADRPILLPAPAELALPERAVQFGTGALLRGLVDYFMDAANRAGLEAGRVVMVGSTGSGRDARLNAQDGLYTLVTQGLVDGEPVRELRVIGAVSRALAAATEWDAVLRVAEDPAIDLVFSNTTEVGIVFDEGDAALGADGMLPRSFPARLARWLLHRARHFSLDVARAPVVIPCELVERNGEKLREIVLRHAERWHVTAGERAWLGRVSFCDTLVDRIVPGAPAGEQAAALAEELGYDDAMLTMCEPYRLFAIRGDQALRARLRFADGDAGVLVSDDIAPYRERKVRLLNGAHTALVHLALLAGCETVREAMVHPALGGFTRRVLLEEIVPGVEVPGAERFAADVLDRFTNPHIRHALWDITLQTTAKLQVRLVPSILAYARRTGQAPAALALAFAGYLAFERGDLQQARIAAGLALPADEKAASVRARWSGVGDDLASIAAMVRDVCRDDVLWGTNLDAVPGFSALVSESLLRIRREGVQSALAAESEVRA